MSRSDIDGRIAGAPSPGDGGAIWAALSLPTEHVHHIDGNRLNNALSNLQLLCHGHHARLTNTRPAHSSCTAGTAASPARHGAHAFTRHSLSNRATSFAAAQCYRAWRRRVSAAHRHNLPLPTKAPICPLEDLLFQT